MKNKKKCQKKKRTESYWILFVNSTIWSFLKVLAFFVLFLSIFVFFYLFFTSDGVGVGVGVGVVFKAESYKRLLPGENQKLMIIMIRLSESEVEAEG